MADEATSTLPPELKCPRCGALHALIACPQVKAVELDEHGNVIHVEFLVPIDYHRPVQGQPVEDRNYPRLGEKTSA